MLAKVLFDAEREWTARQARQDLPASPFLHDAGIQAVAEPEHDDKQTWTGTSFDWPVLEGIVLQSVRCVGRFLHFV